VVPACEKLPTLSNNQKIAAGAAIGAAAGLLVTRATGGTKGRHYATGALGGALVGALAGSAFKNEIDVEEQPDGSVRLKIPGSVMFGSGQSALSTGFQSTLSSVTSTVKKYCGVTVRVVGHTDSHGAASANQQLSERRAAAVQSHMQGQGLERARVAIEGKGANQPVASNGNDAGRQQNRRVEIFVRPPAS
jgi:outer membrane protein OmpA-like peptidoglycan-associated protein